MKEKKPKQKQQTKKTRTKQKNPKLTTTKPHKIQTKTKPQGLESFARPTHCSDLSVHDPSWCHQLHSKLLKLSPAS